MNEPKIPMLENPDAIFQDEAGFWYAGQLVDVHQIRWAIWNEYDSPPEKYRVTDQTPHGEDPAPVNVRNWLDEHRTMMRHMYLRHKVHIM